MDERRMQRSVWDEGRDIWVEAHVDRGIRMAEGIWQRLEEWAT